ncbi:MAG: S-(hydroxymethyl)glutathione dehydrogenase/alcohol dehydrogenase [Hyphomicrobiaceae bacterium]|jgi:S-(hydroxymethyl)glutathione dehydrogenase/alcohol dehydrogenase
MKACLFLENLAPMVVEELTLDPPSAPGQVHVKWAASGVCHSDLSIWDGKLPIPPGCILGHEGAGVVIDAGDNSIGLRNGDHVVGSFVPACGACFYCANGQPFICENALMTGMSIMPFNRSDGSKMFGAVGGLATFAEESVVHESALVKIPSDFPLEQACLVGCGVTTGVGAALNAAKVQPGQTVAVIGCGGVGQSVIQGCRIAGAGTIIAIDLNEAKRATAIKFGATHTHDPTVGDTLEFVQGLTEGRGVDVAFEVVGVPALQRQAYDMTRSGGITCFVGVPDLNDEVSLPAALIALQNKTIVGTIYGSADVRQDFVKFVNMAKAGDLDLASMVSQRITINDINEAFVAMKEGDVIRSVVIYD